MEQYAKKLPKRNPKSMPKLTRKQCPKLEQRRACQASKDVVSWKGKNLILSAERRSVVQKLGSRGLLAERCLYAQMMEN